MIKVFLIDDSALVRAFLEEVLAEDNEIEVVGKTVDAYFAMNKIKTLKPDIILLDIQMPKMDGIEFLKKLMHEYPTPVIMFSSLTQDGSEMTIKALELGAIDYIAKPQENLTDNLAKVKKLIISKIKSLTNKHVKEIISKRPELIMKDTDIIKKTTARKTAMKPNIKPKPPGLVKKTDSIILIGASTGGTRAVTEILKVMPENSPPIVVVQHMPALFTSKFAENVDRVSAIKVSEAKDKDILETGKAFIAPGGKHTLIKRDRRGYYLNVVEGPPVNHHKPSVDVLFRSAAKTLKHKAIGVILTGMGSDGAVGMAEMKIAGAYNIAQNKDTCVVFGMPKEAISRKATNIVLPLDDIPIHILQKIGYID
ncbi:MAG: protein-glutamate methylesterase/protein-glutamine glutaminase [Spirochaetota bacterium]